MKSSADLLKAAFDKKKKEKKISMQSIANRLGISRSLLSQILSGTRRLPMKKLDALCQILDLDKTKRDAIARDFLKEQNLSDAFHLVDALSAEKSKTSKPDWVFLKKDQFAVLQDWFYLAVLEATLLEKYDGTAEFLSKSLSVPKGQVEKALQLLKKNEPPRVSKRALDQERQFE